MTTVLAFFLHENDWFTVFGEIPQGIPVLVLPPFSVPEVRDESGQILQEYQNFWQIIQYLGVGLVVLPLVGLLENISICKAFGE